jgi:Zn-dependent protease with chaperone function
MTDPGHNETVVDAKRRGLAILVVYALPPAVLVGLVIGALVSWIVGAIVLVVLAIGLGARVWWGSEPMAARLLGGDQADPITHARLVNLVDGLGTAVGVPAPHLRVIADPALNAASAGVGPHSATLVVTSGLLEELNRIELEAVVAYELVRIKNVDILPATLGVLATGPGARALRRAASTPSTVLAWLWTACAVPFVPVRALMLGASSPSREALMDRSAVAVTRYPPGLLSALEKVGEAGLADMLRGGVIMDVVNAEQAKVAEDAGAVAVMALERVPADIRRDGGVARMSDPELIEGIQAAVTIPVMAKARIGHFAEAQVLQSLGVDFIDESEVLTPADEAHHIDKWGFTVPFVCGATNLGEALRRISEGAAMIRSRARPGPGTSSRPCATCARSWATCDRSPPGRRRPSSTAGPRSWRADRAGAGDRRDSGACRCRCSAPAASPRRPTPPW